MQYRFSYSTDLKTVQPQLQFQIPNPPQGWNTNLPTDEKKKLIRPFIVHILRNTQHFRAFIGKRSWTDVYSYYDDDYEYHRDEHLVNNGENFIVCLVGNDIEEYCF